MRMSRHNRSTAILLTGRDASDQQEAAPSRYEAQTISSRPAASDPYAAWLERREAERRRQEQPRIRWVHRLSGDVGRVGVTGGGSTGESPEDRGRSTDPEYEYESVGA
jgi:hypothetical protein